MKKEITGHTKLTGLLGSPVAHSISPAMHNHSFELLDLDYAYLAFDVTKESFSRAIDGLLALNAVGWNCTMPLKRLMYERCDTLSDTATLTGAVNTVVNRNGRLFGDNTDGYGFMQAMADAGFHPQGKKVTILGSGGAAAAIAAQAALTGVTAIDLFSRPASTSTKLMEEEAGRIQNATSCRIFLYDLQDFDQLKKSLFESYALINASSMGMSPNEGASLIPDASFLFPELIVGDIIYNPCETRLLTQAKEAGCPCFNGLYMLLHQGALAFKRWTGKEMPVEEIRTAFFQ